MKTLICFSLPVFLLAGVLAGPKQEFWEKKGYLKWSQKECNKLLRDSPWAKQFTLTGVQIMNASRESTDSQQPYIKYQVQLRSALPIRQAIVRQMQIAQKYEKLPSDQKQQFDKSAGSFLSADLSQAVIVYVTYEANNRNIDRELAQYWQSKTTELLKNSVFLILDEGDKIPLAQFAAGSGAQRSFQFIFPRRIEGKPIIDSTDKSLKLEFQYPVIEKMGDGRAYVEFKVEKMILDGNAAY